VLAIDPSSRRTGGALLGDRARIATDPEDRGVFVRSMAARDRLGGLASLTVSAMVLMRALYDVVLIETVGVGQSETDVAGAADTVVLCLQPGSGDTLQFMKAGIVEIPHVIAVTKADLGELAERTRVDVSAALQLVRAAGAATWRVPILAVSALRRDGVERLLAALDGHRAALGEAGLREIRAHQAETWLRDGIRERFGREGLRRAGATTVPSGHSPFRELGRMASALRAEIFGADAPPG
jgi:LAO/AO transport system kinase